jgi:aminoglycoside 3-N-acetyltransferase
MPVLSEGKRIGIELEELDSSEGIVNWEGDDYFDLIGRAFIESGTVSSGRVGKAQTHLFDARMLTEFAKLWMEREFVEKEKPPVR